MCEELGFIGAIALIVLFGALIVQGIAIALNAPDFFGSLLGIGIMAQVAWQVFCHIGVATALLPNTGISLPFFSYGGTSLLILLGEMGIMLSISRAGNGRREARPPAGTGGNGKPPAPEKHLPPPQSLTAEIYKATPQAPKGVQRSA